MSFLADLDPKSFYNAEPGSPRLYFMIFLTVVIGLGVIGVFMVAPIRMRRPIVSVVTFLAGLFWVLEFTWPKAIARGPLDKPNGFVEQVGFMLHDGVPAVADLANTVSSFLLGLGVYSLLRVHLRKVFKQQKDWSFSLVLVLSLLTMVAFGYVDWNMRLGVNGAKLDDPSQWGNWNYGKDLFFDGFLQQMDAAMFSMIAFFILSAAYRAFRMRSAEATILLGAAFLVLISSLGLIENIVNNWVMNTLAKGDGNSFWVNFKLTEISGWIKDTFQTSSIRGIEFGVGIGLLAMGLRIWLSLERTGGQA
ncbi:MAG: hypothetical protein HYR64_00255 [Fimbriimonas ginsengisoli]|uniref:Uncharacterized protein n=1 Tax=Fimbriimonas ginsengisoli TaxID=1005039 RepID=A0A931LQI2_FIMGI|nr:hypothetical protein [Fimbriimonas ginsengisoli]